jgi:hypothetical protein
MERLPDEMLVMLLCKFWNVERCSVESEITEHPFVSMSLVCKRFSFVCREYFPTSYHAERISKLFRTRIASSVRKSAIWQRKCFKCSWIKDLPNPYDASTIPLYYWMVIAKQNLANNNIAETLQWSFHCLLPKYGFSTKEPYNMEGIPSSTNRPPSYRISVMEYVVFDCDVARYQILSGQTVIADGYNVKAGTHVPICPKYGGLPNALLLCHDRVLFCNPLDSTVTKIKVTFLGKCSTSDFEEYCLIPTKLAC